MEVKTFDIEGLFLIEPTVYSDSRGYFLETYNRAIFERKTGKRPEFVQDNESRSLRGVVRGLHFQKSPHAQGKLVRVIQGRVRDVAVDIRKDSPTFGRHVVQELCGEQKRQFYIPPGFAHGFSVLEDHTVLAYKCTDFHHPESEDILAWDDPDLNIDWGITDPILSEKDRTLGKYLVDL